ncbi:hypothetical protein OU995_03550 [Roseateles sp. SL47]|uniref:hypothetical protein n=1 Tax=Roseateles sp. SL47 TaxID=2995138 RepID=UPI0022701766|nr:hypothetical protein [Roseateles sp. SL47]WAC73824.1 hypothetical protein OU995_03550 [Roseateles sp. SL47]
MMSKKIFSKKGKLAIGALLAISTAVAVAVSYGKWKCDDCTIYKNTTDKTLASQIADVYSFLKSEVNSKVKQWKPADTVSICDGSLCLLLTYNASGQHYVTGGPTTDTGGPYKNSDSYAEASEIDTTGSESGTGACYAITETTWINWSACSAGSECESGSTYVGTEIVGTEGDC